MYGFMAFSEEKAGRLGSAERGSDNGLAYDIRAPHVKGVCTQGSNVCDPPPLLSLVDWGTSVRQPCFSI